MTGSTESDTYPLPLTADDLTVDWLTAAVCTRYPGVRVRQARRLEVIEGTATKVLLALDYEGDGGDLPERLWVKGGFGAHREYLGALGVYGGEVQFFAEVAPATRCTFPEIISLWPRMNRYRASSRSRIWASEASRSPGPPDR